MNVRKIASSEICIVINDKSQGSIAKHLRYDVLLYYTFIIQYVSDRSFTRSSAIAEGPRDASCQLKSCQLPRNNAETTYTTSPDQIDVMKLEM